MSKFEVHIYGTLPQCLEVEAATAAGAEDKALAMVIENLEFSAAPCEEEPAPAAAIKAIPPQAKKRRRAGHE